MTAHSISDVRSVVYCLGGHPADAFGPAPQRYLPVAFNEATVHAVTQAYRTRASRVQSSATLATEAHQIAVQNVHRALVSILEAVVREGGLGAVPDLDARLRGLMPSGGRFVADVAEDAAVLVNVRGLAARLVAAHDPGGDLTDRLLASPSVFVRLGVAIGLADAEAWDVLSRMRTDLSPAVAAEVRFLLADTE